MTGPGPAAFERLADRLDGHLALRHGLFVILAAAAIAIVGYHFGTFDQIVHVPFLRAMADSELYPGDAFVNLRSRHYSFFWRPFVPLVRSGHLEEAMAATHFIATYLTFWAFWSLSKALYDRPAAALVAVLCLVFPHVGFLGFPIIEFSLLNRTFVLPFLLFSVILFLRGRVVLAFLLLGAMYNLHLLSVHFALAMLLALGVAWRDRVGLRALLLGAAVFLVAASPVLLWKAGDGTGLDWSVRPDWVAAHCRGMLYNICYVVDAAPLVLGLSAGGLAGLVLLASADRLAPSRDHDGAVRVFALTGIAILALETTVIRWWPVTWLLQLQVTRVGLLLLVLAYISFAHYLLDRWSRGRMPATNAALVGGTLALSTTPVLPLLAWLWLRRRTEAVPVAAAVVAPVASFALSAAVVLALGVWAPGIHVRAPIDPWVDVQLWARDNTDRDALFVTPPDNSVLTVSDWRVHSERSSLASLSEILEIALAPSHLQVWQPRFEALAPGALDAFDGMFLDNVRLTSRAFARLDEADFLGLACRYGVDYLVVDRGRRLAFEAVYTNAGYRVYDLRGMACP